MEQQTSKKLTFDLEIIMVGFQPSIILAWSLNESAHAQEEWIIREIFR